MNRHANDNHEMSNELTHAVNSIAKMNAPRDAIERLISAAIETPVDSRSSLRSSSLPTLTSTKGSRTNSRVWKLAMAAVIATVCLFFASGWLNQPNRLYANMQRVVSQYSTINLVSSVLDENGEILRSLTGYVDERGLIRQENSNGTVMIADFQQELGMELVPATSKARIFPLYQTDMSLDFFDAVLGLLRGETVDSAEEVARHDVDGTTLVEFAVEGSGVTASVFVDLETNQPTKIELDHGESGPRVVMDQLVFGMPHDPGLYLLEAPEGFEVTRVERAEPANDAELVLTPGVGLGPVKFGFDTAQVIAVFGEPEDLGQAEDRVFIDGEWETQMLDILTYNGRGLQIHVDPRHGVKTITAVDISSGFVPAGHAFTGGLAAGDESVRMGDSAERVLELLGDPDEPTELGETFDSLTYWDEEQSLTTSVRFFESKVVSFSSHKEF